MGIVAFAVFAVKDQSWVELPLLGFSLVLTHLGLLFWETRYVSVSLAFPGLKPPPPGHRRRRRQGGSTLVILGLDFPPDQPRHRVARHPVRGATPFAVNKVVILMWLSASLVAVFFIVAEPAPASLVPDRRAERGRVGRSTSSARASSCRRWGRTGLRLHAVPAHAVQLHLRLQHLGDHPGRPDAGERPHRPARRFMAILVWVIFNVVGIKNQGSSATSRTCCSRPACRRRSTSW